MLGRWKATRGTLIDAVMSRRNALVAALVGIAIVIAVALWLVFRASDEQQVRDCIALAAGAVHTSEDDTNPIVRLARIKGALKDSMEKDARVNVQEVQGVPASLSGIDEIAGAAAQGLGAFQSASLDVSSLEIKMDDAKLGAQVNATATFDGVERGGRRRVDRRNVTFTMVKSDRWRVRTVAVWAQTQS
jgi:hypothetical protein